MENIASSGHERSVTRSGPTILLSTVAGAATPRIGGHTTRALHAVLIACFKTMVPDLLRHFFPSKACRD
jgi:hypothetical protein